MNNMKKAREAAGLSQKQVAIALGVSPPTVSEWESGKKNPNSNNLKELVTLYNASADYILGLTNEPLPANKKSSGGEPELDGLEGIDFAFIGDYNDLTEKDKQTIREMARLLKERDSQ